MPGMVLGKRLSMAFRRSWVMWAPNQEQYKLAVSVTDICAKCCGSIKKWAWTGLGVSRSPNGGSYIQSVEQPLPYGEWRRGVMFSPLTGKVCCAGGYFTSVGEEAGHCLLLFSLILTFYIHRDFNITIKIWLEKNSISYYTQCSNGINPCLYLDSKNQSEIPNLWPYLWFLQHSLVPVETVVEQCFWRRRLKINI